MGLSIFSAICGIIKIRFSPDTNALLLPLTLICMVIYFVFYKISKQKLWYVFVSVMAVFSFAGLSSYIIEAHINENGKVSDLQTYGLIAQWIVIVGFMIITALMLPKIKWLIDDYHLENVWRFIWLIPMLITVANILMVPQDYSTVNVGRLFEIYIVVDTSFLIFYVLFQFMLYIIAKAVTNKANAEQNAQMLGIQATEYNILTKYIEDTSRLRHDFRQVARTSVRLAKSNDTHALINLLDKYNETVEDSHSQKIFCEHNALNAIVEYYYDEAIQNKIRCNWNIDIPENIKKAIEQMLWFYRCGKDVSSSKGNGKSKGVTQIYSFEYDDDYIYSAFLDQYNIDLQDIEYLHWWKFKAMFKSLKDDNMIVKIMGYRSMDLSKVKDKEQKAYYKRMQKLYEIPISKNEQNKLDDITIALLSGGDLSKVL